MNPEFSAASEPTEWFVVFHRKSANRLLGWLAVGEFKHVAAFGYCPGFKAWLIYDVEWSGTRIKLLPHNEFGKAAIAAWTAGCCILKLPHAGKIPHLSSRIGFYCVTAVKHLVGLRCVATTPSQLYRHILRNGGIVISEGTKPAPDPGGSEPCC